MKVKRGVRFEECFFRYTIAGSFAVRRFVLSPREEKSRKAKFSN